MGMTPISMEIDSYQRLWLIVIEYSNIRLIQYLLYTVPLLYSSSTGANTLPVFTDNVDRCP